MAVSKKGLRQVTYKGQRYFWSVNESDALIPEGGFVAPPARERLLHIISADKRFIVHYRIPAVDEPAALLRVEGSLFPRAPGRAEAEVPRWRHDSKRYPTADFVRRLIDWCMTAD
jgi:hypothetical protein